MIIRYLQKVVIKENSRDMAKKRQGHYCKICGEHKANEKFSGKGHAAHICKSCASLPIERKNELQRINQG